ncbi:unnamed protein product [Colletotrichum noveboracense]|uniref:Uncharacterized protein n=1 Tax=Colletotrichum noveboracense TaxID=2664923 RepID=A0A9W4S1L0_9PEZI|nr:unnamed protein product [Colletotrichum noveboracense]
MASQNLLPAPHSILYEAKYCLWRAGSESYRWGFFLYRTTYVNQALWERYLEHIRGCIDAQLNFETEFDKERLMRHFRLNVIEDPTLDNAPVELVRQRFMTWVSALPPEGCQQQDVPPIQHRDPVLFSYPLYAVEDGQHDDDASDLVFVKAINAEQPWTRNGSEDKEEDMDEEENGQNINQHGGNNNMQKDNQHDPEYY